MNLHDVPSAKDTMLEYLRLRYRSYRWELRDPPHEGQSRYAYQSSEDNWTHMRLESINNDYVPDHQYWLATGRLHR